jgi:integrase
MATINFRLKNGKTTDNKEQSIYIRYKYGRLVDYQASTGIKVLPKYWNPKRQEVKNISEATNRTYINRFLSDLKNYLTAYETEILTSGGKPTKEAIKSHYQAYFKAPQETKKEVTLLSFIDDFINSDEVKHKTKGTIKTYRSALNVLKKFNDERYPINFNDIDLQFRLDFIDYCENSNYTPNYIGKLIQILKYFMNEALDKDLHNNTKHKHRKFTKPKADQAHNIYLTESELSKIYQLDLSNNPKLDLARDLFLVGAHTGLRVSDFNNLKPDDLMEYKGNDYLKVKTSKTDKEVFIPLRSEVKSIFKKYGNRPPHKMPDQHINYKIKDVCQNAGIDEVLHIDQTKGGKKMTLKKFKFELVGTHTARRSFCTNAYLSGMNTLDIMNISGHTSEKTFLNYIKADALQRAHKVADNDFFKPKSSKLKIAK